MDKVKLYDICILQPPVTDPDGHAVPQVEACESDDGLELYESRLPPDGSEEDMETHHWGTLTLDGWRTLCQMFALRHPAQFAPIVTLWERFCATHASPTTPEAPHA